jgi:uncharacterized protein
MEDYSRYTRRRIKKSFLPNVILNFFSNLSLTSLLIWINVIFFIVVLVAGIFYPEIVNLVALLPVSILQGKTLWALITHMFMHAGFFHLFINMFVLFSLGGLMEKIIGRKRFFWFYIISGLFAGILSVLLSGLFGNIDGSLGQRIFGNPGMMMVGASGAIFAIAGLFVVLLPRLKFSIIFLPFFSLPGFIMIPLALVVMWVATVGAGLPIGNVAHFGGFLMGLIYGLYLKKKFSKKVTSLRKMFR